MNRYNVITTVDIEQIELDENGNPVIIIIPAGSVINTVVWDGVTEWTPPENTRVEPEFMLPTTASD
jgi:hypothetical protein